MKILDHLEVIKKLIEGLPSAPTVKFFSGSLKPEDLKSLKLDGTRPYVLLSYIGGPANVASAKLEIDAIYGAWAVGKVDPKTLGMSFIAIETAFEIAKRIRSYRGDPAINTSLPVVQFVEEAFNGVTDGKSGYSSWSVTWSQRFAIV